MAKDEAAERASFAQIAATQREAAEAFGPKPQSVWQPPPPLPEPPPPPPDPLDLAREELWEAFEAAEPTEQLALFQGALTEQDVLDAEMAFDMLTKIRSQPDRAEFTQALTLLCDQRPELYQHDVSYYIDWQIADALAAGDLAALPALGATLATTAGKQLENFYVALNRLAYHGQLAVAAQIMAQAWPYVSADQGLLPWAPGHFAQRAMDMTLFAHFERSPDLRPDDPELLAALQVFMPVALDETIRYITLLNGQAAHSWSLNDFKFGRRVRPNQDDEDTAIDPVDKHWQDLLLAFVGALYRDGVSLAKSDMARHALGEYFPDRHAGNLKERPAAFERARPKGSKPPRAERRPTTTTHPLYPDHDTLARFVGGLLGFMSMRGYSAATLLELLPAWLRFLEGHELITAEQRAAALEDLRPLVADAAPIWETRTEDAAVGPNIQLAWERA